jgi:site-specific recombinase XerD
MAELEPIAPADAKEMYLAQRRDEVAESTLQSHHYRLNPFVRWCESNGVTNLNELSARDLHKYRLHRKEKDDLNTVTLRTQLSTIRVFVKFLESIDGVKQGLHDKMLIPSPDRGEDTRDRMLEAESATTMLDHLRRYEYASKPHALLSVLWATGCRMGGAHSLDVSDFDAEEQSLAFRHRPEQGTRLKNKQSGERLCALSTDVCEVLRDYIGVNRDAVTDDHGREPLFTTRGGRMHKSNIREMVYATTRPCEYGQDCPHDRDPDSCEATAYTRASKCPSSVSPHDIRRGALTHLLKNDVPKEVVSDRANVGQDVLDKHYNRMTEEEKMEQRREYLDSM